jgi:hypothetical protein
MSYDRLANYRLTKATDDPLLEVTLIIANTIFAISGPFFWGVLVIALLTNFIR